ncbi:MAG: SoxR reducing system RseC family protein [Gammaproteobacteria bacterium]|nr:SoxR reducing system RseC family protein [Gammaproteobacteria bacterium]
MIEQNATVVKLDRDLVWVQTEQKSVCGQCAVNKGCGTAIIGDYFQSRQKRLAVLKTLSVSEGDRVVIGLEEQALIKGSVAVYIVPLLVMFGFGLLGEVLQQQLLLQSELVTVILALLGLGLGAVWLRYF